MGQQSSHGVANGWWEHRVISSSLEEITTDQAVIVSWREREERGGQSCVTRSPAWAVSSGGEWHNFWWQLLSLSLTAPWENKVYQRRTFRLELKISRLVLSLRSRSNVKTLLSPTDASRKALNPSELLESAWVTIVHHCGPSSEPETVPGWWHACPDLGWVTQLGLCCTQLVAAADSCYRALHVAWLTEYRYHIIMDTAHDTQLIRI